MPKLLRYGIESAGPKDPIAIPMDNGYWTPWHLAVVQHNEWLTSMCADWKIDHDSHEFGMQLGVNYKLHEFSNKIALQNKLMEEMVYTNSTKKRKRLASQAR
jgi:hypothetical protein